MWKETNKGLCQISDSTWNGFRISSQMFTIRVSTSWHSLSQAIFKHLHRLLLPRASGFLISVYQRQASSCLSHGQGAECVLLMGKMEALETRVVKRDKEWRREAQADWTLDVCVRKSSPEQPTPLELKPPVLRTVKPIPNEAARPLFVVRLSGTWSRVSQHRQYWHLGPRHS